MIAVGLGLAILIHELGHFLVAKRAGVRVERFSIGFGPPLWKTQKGETEYRLSLILAGGYVKLAGEGPSEAKSDDPRIFLNQPPGVRAVVFVAGVAMNVLLGLVLFVAVFSAGYPFILPEAGWIAPGSPAEKAGLREGDLIVEIDGRRDLDYEDVKIAQIFSKPGKSVTMTIARPGTPDPLRLGLVPVKGPGDDFPRWGVEPALSRTVDYVNPESPMAARGLVRPGDKILAIDGKPVASWQAVLDVMRQRPGAEIPLEVERKGHPIETSLIVDIFRDQDLGIEFQGGMIVTDVSPDWPAEQADLRPGDVILAIDGKDVHSWKELRSALNAGEGRPVTVTVQRGPDGTQPSDFKITPVENPPAPAAEVPDYLPRYVFGIRGTFANVVAAVRDGSSAWKAGLRPGDELTAISIREKDAASSRRSFTTFSPDDEIQLDTALNRGAGVELEWRREGAPMSGTLVSQDFKTLAKIDILPRFKEFRRPVKGFGPMRLAIRKSYQTVASILGAARSIARGTLNAKKAFAGPVGVLTMSYKVAQQGLLQFLYWLALINMNLAFVNLLPIPILDGGHLLFVAIEKARGKRLNEKAMEVAQFVGLAILIAILLFTLYADFTRSV
ncbi:MAG: RIP metalloprotease RseP [Planctomycetota bacterium]